MPDWSYDFAKEVELEMQPPVNPGGAERLCVIDIRGLQMRRLGNLEDRFEPYGTYRESWVKLPNWNPLALTAFLGFTTLEELEGQRLSDHFGGSITFRLSYDDGATWFVYDETGSSWVEATGAFVNDWMPKEDVDKWINEFPVNYRQLRIMARFTPSTDGNSTPLLKKVVVFSRYDYDFKENMLRSMKHHIEREIMVRTKWHVAVNDVSRVEVEHQWEFLKEPIRVYNLTDDPNETTNIFSAVDGSGILLSSNQVGNLVVYLFAAPTVYIGAEDFAEYSKIPSIVVSMGSVREKRDLRNHNKETSFSFANFVAWRDYARVWFDVDMRISCQSSLRHEVLAMSASVDRILTDDKVVVDEALDEEMPILSSTPFSPANRVAQGLFVEDYTCTLFAKTWLRLDATEDLDLVQEHKIVVHGLGFDLPDLEDVK